MGRIAAPPGRHLLQGRWSIYADLNQPQNSYGTATMNAPIQPVSLDDLVFDNRLTRELPADPVHENHRRQVLGACYSRVLPRPVAQPELVAYSREMAERLDLTNAAGVLDVDQVETFTQVFSGNRQLPQMDPYATCYGGHQFGTVTTKPRSLVGYQAASGFLNRFFQCFNVQWYQ